MEGVVRYSASACTPWFSSAVVFVAVRLASYPSSIDSSYSGLPLIPPRLLTQAKASLAPAVVSALDGASTPVAGADWPTSHMSAALARSQGKASAAAAAP